MQIERLEDFIANMPKSVSTNTEKARWLYIELGKKSFYDVSYEFYFLWNFLQKNLRKMFTFVKKLYTISNKSIKRRKNMERG